MPVRTVRPFAWDSLWFTINAPAFILVFTFTMVFLDVRDCRLGRGRATAAAWQAWVQGLCRGDQHVSIPALTPLRMVRPCASLWLEQLRATRAHRPGLDAGAHSE